jgi:hypothetical protein
MTFLVTDYTIESSAQSSRNEVKLISRAIIISDALIKSSDSERFSLLHIPKSGDNKSSVNVIEVGGAAIVVPKEFCMKF